jgi:spermidine/putrescine transport system ATP-binding protein
MYNYKHKNPAELTSGRDVMVAVRPERIGILPEDGEIPTLHKAGMNVLMGQVVESNYIGTDTRYTVRVAGEQDVVVRLQNVDYREQFHFSAGENVKIFFPQKSATILDK